MEMISENVSALSHDWRAWLVAALVMVKALVSAVMVVKCPISAGVANVTEDMIAAGKAYRIEPPASFAVLMLMGMTLSIGGLFMLHDSHYGPLALGAIVIGTFVLFTEPTRIYVNAAKHGVYATAGQAGDANALARDRLRGAHRQRAMYEVFIAAAVLALLCLF